MNAKVTVLMSVFNGEKYLKESIESILCQNYSDFEFLIINDCSSDKSADIIKSFKDNRINYTENEKNLGLPASLNKGIDMAKGEYIVRMDADDISHKNRLQKQLLFMEKNPDIGLCGSWIKVFGDMNFIAKYPIKHKNIVSNLFTDCALAHPSIIFRKSLFNKFNLRYDTDFITAEDYELWTRAADYINFANIPEVLLNYRMNPEQKTKSKDILENAHKIIWKKHLDKLEINFSEEDIEFHGLLLCEKYKINDTELFLNSSYKWLDKIIAANNKKQIYDSKILVKKLKNKWYIAFKTILETNPNINILDVLSFSEKYKYLTYKNKLSFLYRLIKTKYKNGLRK